MCCMVPFSQRLMPPPSCACLSPSLLTPGSGHLGRVLGHAAMPLPLSFTPSPGSGQSGPPPRPIDTCSHAPSPLYSPQAVDIWAAGCIFAELVMLKPLFQGLERKAPPNNPFQLDQLDKCVGCSRPWPACLPAHQRLPSYSPAYHQPHSRHTIRLLIPGILTVEGVGFFPSHLLVMMTNTNSHMNGKKAIIKK